MVQQVRQVSSGYSLNVLQRMNGSGVWQARRTARLAEDARRMGMQHLLAEGHRLGSDGGGPASVACSRNPNANRLGRLD